MGDVISAVITTLDNLPILKEQVVVLRDDLLIDKIVVVSNGSRDGTNEWLETRSDITSIVRENKGAGPGRNAGLDAAGDCDHYLMLDGGIRPLRGGTKRMLDYLERTPGADVIGVEIPDFETDRNKAWRRWSEPITSTYVNTRLSHTAYCLARRKVFDGLRFCEDGPFGEPGWGADDDELAYQWREAEITVHVVTGVHPYRRGSGSFRRLYLETGTWPNQYGSVYEKRLVWLQQEWPQYKPGVQWGEPWLTVVVEADGKDTAPMIKFAHDELRKRRFDPPWEQFWNPYSVILWRPDQDGSMDDAFLERWIKATRLHQHHGDVMIVDGYRVPRTERNERVWTGDFRVWYGGDWMEAIRPGTGYFAKVANVSELTSVVAEYNARYPRQGEHEPPTMRMERIDNGRS